MNLSTIFNGEPTREKWAALGNYLQGMSIRGGPGINVRQVGGKYTIAAESGSGLGGGSGVKDLDPFDLILGSQSTEGGGSSYFVRVMPGKVVDHVNQSGDALLYYGPETEVAEGALTGEPKKFTITEGQAVYAMYFTLNTGAIGLPDSGDVPNGWPQEAMDVVNDTENENPCHIIVAADNLESVHYQPAPVGDDTDGSPGVYFVKLGKLEGTAITPFMAGSHIEHYRELPRFLTLGGLEIFQYYGMGEGQYRYRGPVAQSPITITPTASHYLIGLDPTKAANLNLKVRHVKWVAATGTSTVTTEISLPPMDGTTTITIPAHTGTTGTGAYPHTPDGEHTHSISGTTNTTNIWIGDTVVGEHSPHSHSVNTGEDATGNHDHDFDIEDGAASTGSAHTHTVQIPEQELTGITITFTPPSTTEVSLEVPNQGGSFAAGTTAPYTLVWRNGLFVGEFGESQEGDIPAVQLDGNGNPIGGALISKTIVVLDPTDTPVYP